jgi:hypothetical protein
VSQLSKIIGTGKEPGNFVAVVRNTIKNQDTNQGQAHSPVLHGSESSCRMEKSVGTNGFKPGIANELYNGGNPSRLGSTHERRPCHLSNSTSLIFSWGDHHHQVMHGSAWQPHKRKRKQIVRTQTYSAP